MTKKHRFILKSLHSYDGDLPHRFKPAEAYKKQAFDLYRWGYLDCRSEPRNNEDYICDGLTEKGIEALNSQWTLDRRLVVLGIGVTALVGIAGIIITLYFGD